MMCCSRTGIIALSMLLLTFLWQGCNRMRNRSAQSNDNSSMAQQTFADPQSAAMQSLATFRKAVNAKNYKELGFESGDEIANATLGPPLRVFFVRRDQLREYQPGADPAQLLTDFGEMNYPVLLRSRCARRLSSRKSMVDGKC
jgi:hypothetical protein